MESVWITKVWRDTVWALLHHIKIKTHGVVYPRVTISGSGNNAGIVLEIPIAAEKKVLAPLFAVSIENGKIQVSKGFANRNGSFFEVAEQKDIVISASGILCLVSRYKDKKWEDFRYEITEPAPEAYPIAEIQKSGASWIVTQYPVSVAVFVISKHCPLAKNAGG